MSDLPHRRPRRRRDGRRPRRPHHEPDQQRPCRRRQRLLSPRRPNRSPRRSRAARAVGDPLDAIADPDVDAVVLATPGPTHEKQLLACLEHGKPVLCEKPLTTDVETSLAVVKREAELGKRLIQVGFMRRFDHEYAQLKALLDGGELGQPLVLHCAHRNPAVPPTFDSAMVVRDSLVHEVDVTRFLFDEEIASIQIIKPAANPGAPQGLADPQIAIMRTASGKHVDVELFVTTGVAYEVRTEVVAEKGSAMIGLDVGLVRKSAPGTLGRPASPPASGNASDRPTTPSSSAGSTRSMPARPPATTSTGPTRGTATPPQRCARPASSRSTADSPSRSRSSTARRSRERDMKIALDPDTVPPRLRTARLPAAGRRTGLRVPAADAAPRLHPVLQPSPRR